MVVRLGDAICVAAITFACSSYSVSSNGIEKEITPRPVASGPGIVGVASSYNPYRKVYRSGDIEIASSERYDPTEWTAAIHILYLTDYVYSEDPPDGKPADTVRNSLKDAPVGTPVEEIKRASDAFGLVRARQSIRLSPFDPVRYIPETAMCTAFFCTGHYPEAAEAIERAIQYNPRFVPGYALRAACFVRLNKGEQARVEAKRVLAMEPHFHCWVSLLQVAASIPKVSDPILAALKEAGLPE